MLFCYSLFTYLYLAYIVHNTLTFCNTWMVYEMTKFACTVQLYHQNPCIYWKVAFYLRSNVVISVHERVKAALTVQSCYLVVSCILLQVNVNALGNLQEPTPLSLQSVPVCLNKCRKSTPISNMAHMFIFKHWRLRFLRRHC